MTTALAPKPIIQDAAVIAAILQGDLSGLTPTQRLAYHNAFCERVGLDPFTSGLEYIELNRKLKLYATKATTEQLRKIHEISIDPKSFMREVIEGVYVVTAPASTPSGRTDVSTGAVPIDGLKGEARANAMMKAETKAKRRVTLSICGLGMLDESEVESIPGARRMPANVETEAAPPPPLAPRVFKHVRILERRPRQHPTKPISWMEVSFAVPNPQTGEEEVITLPTASDAKEAAVTLFEQIEPMELVTLTTDIGPRSGKERICRLERHKAGAATPVATPEPPPGDAITVGDIPF